MTLVNSVNPFRLEGQKTAAFEICDDLGRAPDILAIPVGNAGNISAYWAGFREYAAAGLVDGDARGCGASRRPAPRRSCVGHRVERPGDRRDRHPDRRPGVVGRRRSRPATSRGGRIERGHRRRDPRRLPRPRPARGHLLRAGLGGQRRRRAQGGRRPASSTRTRPSSCVLTGHGLKDPHTAERQVPRVHRGRADASGAVAVALGW